MLCQDEQGNDCWETLLLKQHFTTDIDLSYTCQLKKLGIKDATIGVTLYNIFSAKFDNNGWAAPSYKQGEGGQVVAYNANYDYYGALHDLWAVGFAPQAPFHFMAHLSLNF
jgi:iron complex outermembrane receptor protein